MRIDCIWEKDKGDAFFEKHISFSDFNSPSTASIVTQSWLLLLAGPSLTSLILSLREDLPSDKASHNLEPSFPEQGLVATLNSSGWKKVKWFAAFCRLCPPKCITQTKGIYLDEMRNDLKLQTCQVYKRLSIIFCQSFLSLGGWLYLYFLICGEANISAVPEEID